MTIAAYFAFGSALLAAGIAIAIAARSRRSITRWSFVGGLLALAAESAIVGLSAQSTSEDAIIVSQLLRQISIAFIPGPWLLFSVSYARGNAHYFRRKWALAIIAFFALPILAALLFRSELLIAISERGPNSAWILQLGWPSKALHMALLLGMVASLMSLERTFRAAVGTMRWRIKFMLIGLAVLFITRLYTSSQAILFGHIDFSLDAINSAALIISSLLVSRSLLRSGHFDIKVYPSQAVLHNSLTVLIAGLYLFGIGVLAKMVAYVGGDVAFPLKAFGLLVSLVLLALLLQSDRFRFNTRQFISRHFQRPLYDYRTVWRRFSKELSSEVDQTQLCGTLAKLVADVFQTLTVNIWLVDQVEDRLSLSASTARSTNEPNDRALSRDSLEAVKLQFVNSDQPIDIDKSSEKWAKDLTALNPIEFPHGGNRICIPLLGRGEVLGLMIIGDRVGGAPFSIQEFDILRSVGDHAAASLLNAQNSQRQAQSKEMEAFQTMAAFFVHDLKNAASTLNLMVKNLPVHWENPEFRGDALRGISKTGERINKIISQLSELRYDLALRIAPGELNQAVQRALSEAKTPDDIEIVREFGEIPEIAFDREQIVRVITNFIVNAREAMTGGNGRIQISTTTADCQAVIEISDNGSGISPEFLKDGLFRPFKTTKKTGLGIGMFQCKTIVEAHGGRILVESELGKGTTFRVYLPFESNHKETG